MSGTLAAAIAVVFIALSQQTFAQISLDLVSGDKLTLGMSEAAARTAAGSFYSWQPYTPEGLQGVRGVGMATIGLTVKGLERQRSLSYDLIIQFKDGKLLRAIKDWSPPAEASAAEVVQALAAAARTLPSPCTVSSDREAALPQIESTAFALNCGNRHLGIVTLSGDLKQLMILEILAVSTKP